MDINLAGEIEEIGTAGNVKRILLFRSFLCWYTDEATLARAQVINPDGFPHGQRTQEKCVVGFPDICRFTF
jgi:hypothetical protein